MEWLDYLNINSIKRNDIIFQHYTIILKQYIVFLFKYQRLERIEERIQALINKIINCH